MFAIVEDRPVRWSTSSEFNLHTVNNFSYHFGIGNIKYCFGDKSALLFKLQGRVCKSQRSCLVGLTLQYSKRLHLNLLRALSS